MRFQMSGLFGSLAAAGLIFAAGTSEAAVTFSSQALAADGSNFLSGGGSVVGDVFVHTGADFGALNQTAPSSVGGDGNPLAGPRIVNGVDLSSGDSNNYSLSSSNGEISSLFGFGIGIFGAPNNTIYDAAPGDLGGAAQDDGSGGLIAGSGGVIDGAAFNPDITITFTNLVEGDNYRLQILSSDLRLPGGFFGAGDAGARTQSITSDSPGTVPLAFDGNIGSPFANGVNDAEVALVTGLFTADASGTLSVTLSATGTNDNALINGFVLQNLDQEVIPEPNSLALLSLGGMMFLRRRRSS